MPQPSRSFRPQTGGPRPDFSHVPVTPEVLLKLRRLAELRSLVKQPSGNHFTIYQNDPVRFVHEVLHEHLWSKQIEILGSVLTNRRTAVKSCHESGKSWLAGRVAAWWGACHPPGDAFVVTSAPTFPQVRAILWREINRAHAKGNLPGYTNQTEWLINDELVAFGRKPEDSSPDAFQGIHALKMLVIFDEAGGIPRALWDAADSLIANEGGKFLVIGNPDDPSTEFASVCQPGSGWNVITINAFSTPNFTGEDIPNSLRPLLIGPTWVDEKQKKWGTSSPIYISKILGEFPESSEDALVPTSWVHDAVLREMEPGDPVELGVDIARFGRNESVVISRRGPVARIFGTMRKRDTMEVVGLVVRAIRETGAIRVKIDDAGLGGGVTDRLRELQREGEIPRSVQVVPVIVGVTLSGMVPEAEKVERFENVNAVVHGMDVLRFRDVKAQLNWALRERFRTGDIDLDDDLDLQAQACAIRYLFDSRGRLVIESKEDMEERILKIGGISGDSGSPDRWDALVLAFAEVEEESSWAALARKAASEKR